MFRGALLLRRLKEPVFGEPRTGDLPIKFNCGEFGGSSCLDIFEVLLLACEDSVPGRIKFY